MDLNTDNSASIRTGTPRQEQPRTTNFANDAFSFWKLPETCRPPLEALIEESERNARHYLFEEYLEHSQRQPSSILNYYYRIKGLIPEGVRHWLNSVAIRARRKPAFPDWPCEDALLRVWRRALAAFMQRLDAQDMWHLGFWPYGKSCAVVLTHDVESPQGFAAMERMAELEERYAMRSAWNLPLEQYPIDWKRVDELRARGFEFGAHGLKHDGRLFRSELDFKILAARIRRIAREHGLKGFRSPSTLRRAPWIAQLECEFDGSFADTDIFEPQPGGTCSIFPFFLDPTVVELPYTLPQDHTMIHLLGRDPLSTWIRKARWISSWGGMILVLVHPDYCGKGANLEAYGKLLEYLSQIENAWHALPSQVAQWWRDRNRAQLHLIDGQPMVRSEHCGVRPRLLSQETLARWECKPDAGSDGSAQ
jgi:peptidoglycan/xylan/chitin deacetylase (PgdA/CDA1 family)